MFPTLKHGGSKLRRTSFRACQSWVTEIVSDLARKHGTQS